MPKIRRWNTNPFFNRHCLRRHRISFLNSLLFISRGRKRSLKIHGSHKIFIDLHWTRSLIFKWLYMCGSLSCNLLMESFLFLNSRCVRPVSDLERAIAGLAQFDRRCPPNICLVGHFGAANICRYWIAISLRFLSFWKTLCDFKFHRIGNIKQCAFYEKWLPETEWRFLGTSRIIHWEGGQFIKMHVLIANPLLFTLDRWNATCYFGCFFRRSASLL